MTIEEQAFAYHVAGFSVMPIKKDKRPFLASWKQYQEESASDVQVVEWFEKTYKGANIGIITGKISGITVIDIDVDKTTGKLRTPISKFPKTFTVKTGNGGVHLYYKYHPGLTVSANAYPDMPGVDIRNDGGFVVAAPSVTSYEKDGKMVGGEYKAVGAMEFADFPAHLFGNAKPKRTLTEMTTAPKGARNDTLASFAGKLLQSSKESEWYTEVLPAVERANKTYTPPLPLAEVHATFESILKKEKARREGLVVSPIQLKDDNGDNIGEVKLQIRRNGHGVAYKDMANALAVLQDHPYYKDTIKYNEFRQEIEYNDKPLEDADIVKIQYFMQLDIGLHGISKEAVYSAIVHYANKNKYDEAQDWLTGLKWDGTERLNSWIASATGVEDDDYHQGIGAQWFMGMIRRIMLPGSIFDYMLVLVGPQGIGKTSLFRIIGGKWYKSYTGAMDNKDFYLALRGAIIIDLDEGATLYKSEAIKIKSIITETHDEFRAPYDRVMKKYPRRFVFSMSTNDTEPFRDVTGNRRYWVIDAEKGINFAWLEENREQLFAEAYHYFKEKIAVIEVPIDKALAKQAAHLPDDSWTELVMNQLKKSYEYCKGDPEYSVTVHEMYAGIFPDDSLSRLDRKQEMRIANILRKEAGMDKRQIMIDGERKTRWFISDAKVKELQKSNLPINQTEFDKF